MIDVFCWGTFDNLHQGHVEFLKDAKRRGDYLTVIVISDESAHENKSGTPTQSQFGRVRALNSLGIADAVYAATDRLEFNLKAIAAMKPEVFVFGYDQQTPVEEKLKRYLSSKGVFPKYIVSKEFVNGIHSSTQRTT